MKSRVIADATLEEKNGHLHAVFRNIRKIPVGNTELCRCDFCSQEMGLFSLINEDELVQPEYVSKAALNGYLPSSYLLLNIVNFIPSIDRDKFISIFKTILVDNEVPWLLCETCKKNIKDFVDKL